MTTMTRRSALGAVPALLALPVAAMASTGLSAPEIARHHLSEVDLALAEWRASHSATMALNNDDTEEACNRVLDAELDAIDRVFSAPCRTAKDVRAKARAIRENVAISDILHGCERSRWALLASLVTVGG